MWWHESEDGQRLICDLCPRHCPLGPGERGFCFVRENRDGRVVSTTYGRSTGFCIDPIEKKPLNQFYPGTAVLSFGTPGCNLGCTFCQNWTMSRSRDVEAACEKAEPQAIAAAARQHGCRSVAFTYNDPIIWAEYAIDTARACRELGIKTVAVTSGYITETARAGVLRADGRRQRGPEGIHRRVLSRLLRRAIAAGARHAPLAGPREPTWVEITNLIIPQAQRFAGRDTADVRMDRHRAGARRAAALLGVPSRFQADRPRADAAGDAARGLRDRPRRRPAVRVYWQRLRPRAPAHYCPDCGRAVICREWYAVAAFEIHGGRACTAKRRSPAGSTTRPAPGAAGGCR